VQAAILLTLGLQQREVSDLQQELNLPSNQVLALFNKAIRKLHGHLRAVKEAAVERQLPRPPPRATPAAAAQAGMFLSTTQHVWKPTGIRTRMLRQTQPDTNDLQAEGWGLYAIAVAA
jgi:hypothetical protein